MFSLWRIRHLLRKNMFAASSIVDPDSFHEALDIHGTAALRHRFGRRTFSKLQSIIDVDESLSNRLADCLNAECQRGLTTHATNNIAFWLGRSRSQPFLTDILHSFRTVEQHDSHLRPEFLRSHLITLGNVLSERYLRQFLRQLSLRPHFETNLGYYHDYYGSLPSAFREIERRLLAFTYPNCLLDLHTLYHSRDLFHQHFTDITRDLLSSLRHRFEKRDRVLIDGCLTNSHGPVRPRQPIDTSDSRLYMYDAFISHASEDKDAVARPLAEGLVSAGLDIWFDEYSLTAGDSLREKIDAGLAASKFGILILSPPFFSKGWPKAELDGLLSLQIAGRNKIIPILHDLSHKELLDHSPILAGRLCLSTNKNPAELLNRLIPLLS